MRRRRLDAEMVRRGLVASRAEAQEALGAGLVTVDARPATKASTLVGPGDDVRLVGPARRFVSRGGEKLEAAIVGFGIAASGKDCLDIGASTGGFTDCLLRYGAARVVALDVGYGQLAWRLRQDSRVAVLERTNARDLSREDLPFAPELAVGDVSFISWRLIVPALARVIRVGGEVVLLVKPQFEAGPDEVGKGGVVREPAVWRRAVEGVARTLREHGIHELRVMASPLRGPAGNAEFLVYGLLEPAGPGENGVEPGFARELDAAVEGAAASGGSRQAPGAPP